jgi:hypothetical protein
LVQAAVAERVLLELMAAAAEAALEASVQLFQLLAVVDL